MYFYYLSSSCAVLPQPEALRSPSWPLHLPDGFACALSRVLGRGTVSNVTHAISTPDHCTEPHNSCAHASLGTRLPYPGIRVHPFWPALNRSWEFASRPGACPATGLEAATLPCTLDPDCPGLQKCCPSSGEHRCVAPSPGAPQGNPEAFWYNLTVLVKMDFKELQQVDPRLLNHMRLLHSMVTGALQPLDSTVHHLQSAGGDTSNTVSRLLLGLPQPVPVASVSAMLGGLVERVDEVISVQVQGAALPGEGAQREQRVQPARDVNKCFFDELSACSGGELCSNTRGSSQCRCCPESPTSSPRRLPSACEGGWRGSPSSSFQVSWSLNSTWNRTFHVQVYKGEELLRSARTREMTLEVAGLEAGVLYGVSTSYQACGANVTATLTVRTEARAFEVTVRILDRNVTEQLLDRSHPEFQDFSRQLLLEVENSFPPAISDLLGRGKLRLQIMSLQAGSMVVRLRLMVWDPGFPVSVSTLAPMLPPLWASAVFQIDQRGTLIGTSVRTAWSTTARQPPSASTWRAPTPAGDMASTVSPGTGVTASASSTETTAPVSESPALSPSAEHTGGTPAAGQPQTPGSPPWTGGGGVAGQDRNSSGKGVEEQGPSTAPGLGTEPWTASMAPGPTHRPLPGALSSPPDPFGRLPRNSTVELPLRPTATEGPTGHVEWHPSLPAREALPAPLDPTRLQDVDPRPSGSPDLALAPTSVSLSPPGCVPVPIGRVTVSNVTSTSFHVAWVADLTQHPTFGLTLVSMRRPTMHLDTQKTSLILSGLEPGILHLVEIVAKACGQESARVLLKVRTAAQKLTGKVRIANVRYLESFRNASSKEYEDFLELFFGVMRNSLPAAMLRHVDTGRVQVKVTSIANGSVVVAFDLLIIADVDAREVSAAFLGAFQNTSLLEVVRGDTFIQDYDECESREHDCEPRASCLNTFGSFTCSCMGGAPDFPVEYSGRPCEGGYPASVTQDPGSFLAPGPEQPPTPAGTRAASVHSAHQASQGLPQRLKLTGAVRVLCETEKVAVAIQRRFLQRESIPEASLYLGHPACNVTYRNSTHVLLVAGWTECGTVMQSNTTDTVVRTTLRNDLSPEGVIRHLKILGSIHCAFRNHLLMSSGYTPEWGVYAIIEDLHGAGNFVTVMQAFIGDSPIPRNYSVSAIDDVKIEVGLPRLQQSSLKVVLTDCWATPSSDAGDPVMFGFINNSCPVPNTHTHVIENGNSNKAQFKLKIFSFVNNSIVYLHCKLRVCMESPRATCKINCNNVQSLRRGEEPTTHQASWGPLVRDEGEPPGAEPGLGAGSLALVTAAVSALVTGTAALLIVRYRRMAGKYSFKTQSSIFSYQVFHE
ncbi:hypothetical protein MC885_005422 [Smutsia gigantea]|nr:hypothetical protein MC885_005422 [Smutsia gigantea]